MKLCFAIFKIKPRKLLFEWTICIHILNGYYIIDSRLLEVEYSIKSENELSSILLASFDDIRVLSVTTDNLSRHDMLGRSFL